MEYAVLGWADDGPTLRLDYRAFSYAGKFVMSSTGKAVARRSVPEGSDAAESPEVDHHTADGSAANSDGADEDGTDGADGEYDDDVIAAVAFDADRTEPSVCRLRYITVRNDRRGEGIGPRLAAFVAARAADRGYDRARIAVNNPFAYQAMSRAGFAFTGEETGIAELVMERPTGRGAVAERDPATYREGFDVYRERDLSPEEEAFLDGKRGAEPPETVTVPQSL